MTFSQFHNLDFYAPFDFYVGCKQRRNVFRKSCKLHEMSPKCSIRSCCKKYSPNTLLSFHLFPIDNDLRKQWMTAAQAPNPSKYDRICSEHFRKEDYWMAGSAKRLKKNSVPSVFPWTSSDSEKATYLNGAMDATPNEASTSASVIEETTAEINEDSIRSICRLDSSDIVIRSDVNISEAIHAETQTDSNDMSMNQTLIETLLDTSRLQEQVNHLKSQVNQLQVEKNEHHCCADQRNTIFCIAKFANNDSKVLYYTGVQNYAIFKIILKFLLPSGNIDDIKSSPQCPTKAKLHSSKLSPENQFFLTLVKLRRGFDYETLGDIFGMSTSSAGRIFLCWINFMYFRLGSLNIWPHRDVLLKHTSQEFKDKYPRVIGSIDCTEFYIQKPSSMVRQSQCYSNYKSSTTVKSLIMTAPNGAILFTSNLFSGSISDKQIIQESGFLKILKEKIDEGEINAGDIILADKGFNVESLFRDVNIELNIPVYRINGVQFSPDDVQVTRKVAQERIHIERTIGRLKNYKILKHELPVSLLGSMEQIHFVCCLLTNFRYPIRSLEEEKDVEIEHEENEVYEDEECI